MGFHQFRSRVQIQIRRNARIPDGGSKSVDVRNPFDPDHSASHEDGRQPLDVMTPRELATARRGDVEDFQGTSALEG